MRSLRRRHCLMDHNDLLGQCLVLSAHSSKSFAKKVAFFLLTLRSTVEFGELCFELHGVLLFALA